MSSTFACRLWKKNAQRRISDRVGFAVFKDSTALLWSFCDNSSSSGNKRVSARNAGLSAGGRSLRNAQNSRVLRRCITSSHAVLNVSISIPCADFPPSAARGLGAPPLSPRFSSRALRLHATNTLSPIGDMSRTLTAVPVYIGMPQRPPNSRPTAAAAGNGAPDCLFPRSSASTDSRSYQSAARLDALWRHISELVSQPVCPAGSVLLGPSESVLVRFDLISSAGCDMNLEYASRRLSRSFSPFPAVRASIDDGMNILLKK